MTTLTRLFDKGAVSRQRDGRSFRYCAVRDAADLVA
ncbi:BlaI/MecI/CopY family transcriptional regulator [Micromonospora sp. NPDC049301]